MIPPSRSVITPTETAMEQDMHPDYPEKFVDAVESPGGQQDGPQDSPTEDSPQDSPTEEHSDGPTEEHPDGPTEEHLDPVVHGVDQQARDLNVRVETELEDGEIRDDPGNKEDEEETGENPGRGSGSEDEDSKGNPYA